MAELVTTLYQSAALLSYAANCLPSNASAKQTSWASAILQAVKGNCREGLPVKVDEFSVGYLHNLSALRTSLFGYDNNDLLQWKYGIYHAVTALNPKDNPQARLMLLLAHRGFEALKQTTYKERAVEKDLITGSQTILQQALVGNRLVASRFDVPNQEQDHCYKWSQQYWKGDSSPFEEIYGLYLQAICAHMKGDDIAGCVNPLFSKGDEKNSEFKEGMQKVCAVVSANKFADIPSHGTGEARRNWESLRESHLHDEIKPVLQQHLWAYLNKWIVEPTTAETGFWKEMLGIPIPPSFYRSAMAPAEFWEWLDLPVPEHCPRAQKQDVEVTYYDDTSPLLPIVDTSLTMYPAPPNQQGTYGVGGQQPFDSLV